MRFDIDPQFAGMTEHMDHIDDKMLQLEAQNKFMVKKGCQKVNKQPILLICYESYVEVLR